MLEVSAAAAVKLDSAIRIPSLLESDDLGNCDLGFEDFGAGASSFMCKLSIINPFHPTGPFMVPKLVILTKPLINFLFF